MKITHQTQPTWNSCTSTCLAMMINMPAQQVIDEFHDKFHARQLFEDDFLDSKGIKYECANRNEQIESAGIYLLTVPSLNIEGGGHSIVYHVYPAETEGSFYHDLHDPVMGRDGKKFYVTHFHTDPSPLAVKLNFYTIDLVIRHE